MPVSNDIQSLRVKYGYVNSGNSNLTMYIFNWLLVISTAIVVGLVWTLYNKKEGVTEVERKDMLFVGIIASILLFLMVVPINIVRRFTSIVPRHPIYFVYFCLAIFLIIFVGSYHAAVDSSEQKGYIVAILIILGLIILGSGLMLWWTSHPYSKLGIQILGDEDFYAINNKLYTKNIRVIKNIESMNKFLDTSKGELSDSEMKAIQDYYNQKTPRADRKLDINKNTIKNYNDNDKRLLKIQLKNYISDLKREKDNNIVTFYALARFKEGYDIRLTSGSDDNKKEKLKEYITYFEKNNPIDFRKIYPAEPELINKIREEGILTAADYNQYLGYYNPYLGGSSAGYVTNIKSLEKEQEAIKKEKDAATRMAANLKAAREFVNNFNNLIKERVKDVSLTTDNTNEINVLINEKLTTKIDNYIDSLNSDEKQISNANQLAENYFNKFSDCKDGNKVIDFTKKLTNVTKNNIINALKDCLDNKQIGQN